MTQRQRIELRRSEIRSRLAVIAALTAAAVTEEISTERDGLLQELERSEPQLRAAIAAESADESARNADDGQGAELRSMLERGNVGKIVQAAVDRRAVSGVEAELQQHFGVAENAIPLAMMQPEVRAVTPGPDNVAASQQETVPGVFPRSASAFLGVDMPMVGAGDSVFPVITTNASVEALSEGVSGTETTGSYSASKLSNKRLQASFFFSREDLKAFPALSDDLQMNLSDALADALDKEVIAGPSGLLGGTNLIRQAASGEFDYGTYLTALYGAVDGTYAGDTPDIRFVLGSDVFSHAALQYRGENSSDNALERLRNESGGVRVSAHVPAASSTTHKADVIVRLGMRRDMVAPLWDGVEIIYDPYTKPANGQLVVTAFLHYNAAILRSGGFVKRQIQIST